MANKVWRGLATMTASLLVVTMGASSIADSRAGTINSRLGTSNYKTVKAESGTQEDGTYFDSEFSSLGELIKAETEVAEQISAEGSVLLKNDNQFY